jgi:hypothetical protein
VIAGVYVLAATSTGFADPLREAAELDRFGFFAAAGLEPWAALNERLVGDSQRPWRWGWPSDRFVTTRNADGHKTCHPADDPTLTDFIKNGASDVYARALALRTNGPTRGVEQGAFEARMLLMKLAATHGFEGLGKEKFSGDNQCVLDLATAVPVWISAAELLDEAGVLTFSERLSFAWWLGREVYPLAAWAGRTRRNNWGAAGSLAARMIARYVEPLRPLLKEYSPEPHYVFAGDAVQEHDRVQLDRMGTHWPGDSRCPHFGIQSHGGIPDELRRGAAGCQGSALPSEDDPGLTYQTMHVALLVFHAEVLRLEGDASLYELRTESGAPALLQAILFVIDHPEGGPSFDWGFRTSALRFAHRYYGDPRLAAQIEANAHLGFRGGRILPYGQIHGDPGP